MLTWVSGLLSLWQPLHKMDLPLVLAGLRALARTPTTREGHVPVLVVGVPQCCVIVLQDDFGEDAISAVPVFLWKNTRKTVSGRVPGGDLNRGTQSCVKANTLA